MPRTPRNATDRAVAEYQTAKSLHDKHEGREDAAAAHADEVRALAESRIAAADQRVTELTDLGNVIRERFAYAKLNPALPAEYRDQSDDTPAAG